MREFVVKMTEISSQLEGGELAGRLGLFPERPFCPSDFASLTQIGLEQMLILGYFLADAYAGKWSVPRLEADSISTVSIVTEKAHQSAVGFLYGFLTGNNVSIYTPDDIPVEIIARQSFCKKELIHRTCLCNLGEHLFRESLTDKEITREKRQPLHNSVFKRIDDIFLKKGNSFPEIDDLINVFSSYACHGFPLPCGNSTRNCVDWKLIGDIWTLMDDSVANTYYSYAKYAKLAMHPFFLEVANFFDNGTVIVDGIPQNKLKVLIYSGHDLSLPNLAAALGMKLTEMVPYASRIILEMYKDKHGERFIRVLYNGRVKTHELSFCKGIGEGSELCPLKNFVSFVINENLQPYSAKTYNEACGP